MQKIAVVSPSLTFPEGSRLGLTSNTIDYARNYVKKVEGTEHEFEVIDPIAFKRNTILWADRNDCERAEGEFRVIPMPRGFMEDPPEDVARRQKLLAGSQ